MLAALAACILKLNRYGEDVDFYSYVTAYILVTSVLCQLSYITFKILTRLDFSTFPFLLHTSCWKKSHYCTT